MSGHCSALRGPADGHGQRRVDRSAGGAAGPGVPGRGRLGRGSAGAAATGGAPAAGPPICQASGCETTAMGRNRTCQSCARRLATSGLSGDQTRAAPCSRLPGPRPGRLPGGRLRSGVDLGCRRFVPSTRDQRQPTGLTVEQFRTGGCADPLPAHPRCSVASCPRQRRNPDSRYCEPHQLRLRAARRADPGFDEARWRSDGSADRSRRADQSAWPAACWWSPRCCSGCSSAAASTGSAPRKATCGPSLMTCGASRSGAWPTTWLRRRPAWRSRAWSTAWPAMPAGRWSPPRPRSWATSGTWPCSATRAPCRSPAISQPWLREAAKRWAAEDLPRRRVRAGRRTSVGLSVRHHIGALARLSESLRMRPDRGQVPAALGRADMEAFLHRLAFLESTGQISTDARIRACREVRAVLTRIRAAGLTRPGRRRRRASARTSPSASADIPDEPEPAETGRDLPAEIMRQICGHLDDLTSPVMRTAIELAIDTGRRPEEICDLAFDCLARDDDGFAGARLRQPQGQPARPAAADQRAHRHRHHQPAATGTRPLPRTPRSAS